MTPRRAFFDGGLPTRRPRRPDDARFLPKDLAAWERLMAVAVRAGRNPDAHAAALGQAAHRAGRAVPPPGYGGREGPFLRLMLKALAVFGVTGAARAAQAEGLGPLVADCRAALERTAEGPREARERRDVHG